ncbi:MAG: group I truncated hemoglobin [Burkholderiaceae bacterium]|jgi:hemoglobin
MAETEASADNLFDKYGGVKGLTQVVQVFYQRVMSRPNLSRYFTDVDMDALIGHQIKYFAWALGKPAAVYEGADMREAHAKSGITKASFEEVASILADTLRDHEVIEEDVQTILTRIGMMETDIVSR